ncbi:MAG: molecular chaperone [Acidobacteria bacterium]|nr:MAG: molecular chaperone [Acidobacteriota bacterium]PYQ63902.1 MAG: molecular chaperone [Acidobacteriota bacterium]
MNIVRWDPYRDLTSFADRFNRAFGNVTGRERDEELSLGTWVPPVDISEDKERITLTAELPGFREDQVDVQMEGGVLTIRGERKMEEEKEGRNFHRLERSYGHFVRSFTLPNNVDRDNIRASFNNGLLEIEMPKREEAKPKQIKIGTGQESRKQKQIDVR